MDILQGLENDRQKRFRLPQYSTPSPSINQANSEVMQSPSHDIYSGAKAGVAKQVKTALPNSSQEMTSGEIQQQPQSNTGTQEQETTAVVPSIKKTALPYEDDAAKMATSAYAAKSPDMDKLRSATMQQSIAEQDLGSFDPNNQPTSKWRKAAGIATGIATGVLGGGPLKGIDAYHKITRMSGYEQQARLKQKVDSTTASVKSANDVAKAAQDYTQSGVNAANTLQNVGKDTESARQFDEQAPQRDAKQNLDISQANKNDVDAMVAKRPPKPETAVIKPSESLAVTKLSPDETHWETENGQPNSSAQNLTEEDEQIARGAADAAKFLPNNVIKGYRDGDPKMSKFVSEAIRAYKASLNPAFALGEPSQAIQFYDEENQPHTIIFDPRSKKFSPVDEEAVGIKNMTKGKAAPNLNATEEASYRNSKLAATAIPDVIKQVNALRSQLGSSKGRYNNFMTDKVGVDNPAFGALQTALKNVDVFLAATHTGRFTTPLMQEFENAAGNVHQSPDTLIAKLGEMQKSVMRVQKEIEDSGSGSAQVRATKAHREDAASASGSTQHKVGDIVKVKGKNIKISAMHDDGTFDGSEVK